MHAWEAIQKTLHYIDEHISEDIEVEKLAQTASLSLFYFQRLFARLVKKPVREYIKVRRLAHACGALREGNSRILDIAMAYGFRNHETFTRAFKDTYGITPAQYRKNPVGLDNFDKPDLLLNYVMVDEGVPLIGEGLVLEMNRKSLAEPVLFMGVEGQFLFKKGKMLGERPGISGPGEIWETFRRVQQDIPAIPGGRRIGVCYHGNAPVGHTTYFAGLEVEPGKEDPRFARWLLPAREYLVSSFEAENYDQLLASALGKAMKFTRLWLKTHRLRADDFFPEMYYHDTPNTAYMELWTPFVKRDN